MTRHLTLDTLLAHLPPAQLECPGTNGFVDGMKQQYLHTWQMYWRWSCRSCSLFIARVHIVTREEAAALHLYTTEAIYRQLNLDLRQLDMEFAKAEHDGLSVTHVTRHLLPPFVTKWGPYVQLLVRALRKLPDTRVTVYRGMGLPAAELTHLTRGSQHVWSWPAFSSATPDEALAHSFAWANSSGWSAYAWAWCKSFVNPRALEHDVLKPVIFVVHARRGKNISQWNAFFQNEVVLLPCRQIRILSSHPSTDPQGYHFTRIDAEEIESNDASGAHAHDDEVPTCRINVLLIFFGCFGLLLMIMLFCGQ